MSSPYRIPVSGLTTSNTGALSKSPGMTYRWSAVLTEAGAAFGDPVRHGRKTQLRRRRQQASGEHPGVLQIVFAANLAYDPFGKAASIRVVQANGPQHADIETLQFREPYRSDAL